LGIGVGWRGGERRGEGETERIREGGKIHWHLVRLMGDKGEYDNHIIRESIKCQFVQATEDERKQDKNEKRKKKKKQARAICP